MIVVRDGVPTNQGRVQHKCQVFGSEGEVIHARVFHKIQYYVYKSTKTLLRLKTGVQELMESKSCKTKGE